MLNDKLSKSLADLDAAADELLKKSADAEADEEKDKDNEPAPEDIADAAPAKDDEKDKDSEDTDIEKCGDNPTKLTKSEESEEAEDEPIEEKTEENKEDEENSEGNDNAEEGEDEEDTTKEDVEKSVKDDFTANENINKALQSSEFQAAMVDILVKSLSEIEYSMHSSSKDQEKAASVMAKSMQAVLLSNKSLSAENEALKRRVNKLEKSISMGFDKVLDAIDTISTEPAHQRKSMASINVHDKDFNKSLNGSGAVGGFESLSKSQVLSVLNNELYSGNQLVTAQDIISYESGAPLRVELQPLVMSKCK
jgi:hypothetical protein